MAYKYYNNVMDIFVENDFVSSQKDKIEFSAVHFYNSGTSNVTINGIPIAPGTEFGISDSTGAVDLTEYQIVFIDSGGTLVNQLIVIRKIVYNEKPK